MPRSVPFTRTRRGFTLLEVMVIIVVLGILSSIAVVSFTEVRQKTNDRAAETSLVSIGRAAQSLASVKKLGQPTATELKRAAADTDIAAGEGITAAAGTAVEDDPAKYTTDPTNFGYSSSVGKVSYAIGTGPNAGKTGLAMRSKTGSCAFVLLNGLSRVEGWVISDDLGGNCAGRLAYQGPTGTFVNATASKVGSPDAPVGVKAIDSSTATGSPRITISWSAPQASDIWRYRVYRDGVLLVTTSNATTLTYLDQTVAFGTKYTYTVSAVDLAQTNPVVASTEGPKSAPVSALTVPRVPASLTAIAAPSTGTTLTWKPSSGVVTGYKVFLSTDLTEPIYQGKATTFRHQELASGTSYLYNVRAYNDSGVSTAAAITRLSVPDAPSTLLVTEGTARNTLSWSAPTGTVTGYRIFLNGSATALASTSSRTYAHTSLTNGTAYSYTVKAYNTGGDGPASASVTGTPFAVAGAPTALVAAPTNGTVDLSWNAPTSGRITGYRIYINGVLSGQTTAKSFTASGLTNGTSYSFQVASYSNLGQSALSTAVASTPRTIAAAPTNVTAQAGAAQATISFTPSASNGGSAITGYRITAQPGGATMNTATSPATFTGLTNGFEYRFTVRAINAAGLSNASNLSQPVTPIASPVAPTGLTATPANQSVNLSWNMVPSTPGVPVLGYRIYRDNVYIGQVGSTTFNATGLTNGTSYAFQVAAYGPSGESARSSTVSSAPVAVPGAPTGLTATPASASVALSWTAPVPVPGATVLGYRVFVNGSQVAQQAGLTYTATGLSNGTSYSFQVASYGAAGQGPLSAPAVATPRTTPGTPSAVTATATTGGANVTWVAPVSDGGSPLTRYDIVTVPATTTTTAGASSTAQALTGLTNGTTYTIQVRAVNIAGAGTFASSNTTTPLGIPVAPTGLTATPGIAQVSLAWTASTTTTGTPVTGYRIYQDGVQVAQVATNAYNVTGLGNGQTYSFQVSAYGAGGESARSTAAAATTYLAPGTPTGIVGTSGNQQATLSWNAVAPTTAAPVTGYRVYRNGVQVGQTAALTYTVTGLTNGQSANYQVSSYGIGGESGLSGITAITPMTVPTAPTGLTPTVGNTTATLTWTAPSTFNGSPLVRYEVRSTPSTTVQTTTDTTMTFTGLTNGTSYQFEVRAVNGVGAGPWTSLSTAITPIAIPGAPTGLAVTPGNAQLAMTWNTVTSTSGTPVTGYRVYLNGAYSQQVTTTNATATGLLSGTAYQVQVSTYGPAGEGPLSTVVNSTTWDVPSAPLTVAATAGDAGINVSWTAPVANGGQPVTEYRVSIFEYPTTTGTPVQVGLHLAGSPAFIGGLNNGTAYWATVAAFNSVGSGPESTFSGSVTPFGVPAGINAGTYTGTPGNTTAALSWVAVPATAGAPVTGYRIYRDNVLVGTQSTLTFSQTGLTNGTAYSYRVVAYNARGEGPSATVSVTPRTTPTTVTPAPTAAYTTATNVTVSWTASPNNGGSPITNYRIQRARVSDGNTTVHDVGPVLTAVLTDHLPSTSYNYRVYAQNAAGYSLVSGASSNVAIPTAPSVPRTLTATPGNGSAALTWLVPTTVGSGITGYDVYVDGSLVASPTTTSYTATGLTNGTSYNITVRAKNSVAPGPLTAATAVTPRTVPCAPTAPWAYQSGTVGQIDVAFYTLPCTGGAPVSNYRIYADGVFLAAVTTNNIVTAPHSGHAYVYTVSAVNAAGEGPQSPPSNAMASVRSANTAVPTYYNHTPPQKSSGQLLIRGAAVDPNIPTQAIDVIVVVRDANGVVSERIFHAKDNSPTTTGYVAGHGFNAQYVPVGVTATNTYDICLFGQNDNGTRQAFGACTNITW